MPFRDVYPECLQLIDKHDNLFPLLCFESDCHVNQNCAEMIARRVHYLFENVFTTAEMLILYYKYRDKPNSIRGGVFHRDMREPHLLNPMNPYAFRRFMRMGNTYQWIPTDDFLFIRGSNEIIPVENLIRES